jgi:siroheme synthase-like protein
MPGFPIELDLRGRMALVVGLGPVGCRKASGLVISGARVMGVDPQVRGGDRLDGVEIMSEPYRAEHLRGVSLAFAAATPEVNRQVVLDAKAAGVWVSSASDPAAGDFFVPAVWREGGLMLTISTSGASPALAAALRDQAREALGSDGAGLATVLSELRPTVLARVDDPRARHRVLADWGDARWRDLWKNGGAEAVRKELERVLACEGA